MMLCIGIPLILAGLAWGVFNLISLTRFKEVEGRIVGHEIGEKRRRIPLVDFQGSDGKTIRFRDSGGGTTIHIGEPEVEMLGSNDAIPVVVLYNPGDPARAKIKNFRNLLLGPFILFVIGVGFALAQIPAVAAGLEKLNWPPP